MQAVGGDEDQTPTEVLAEREKNKQAVVYSSDTTATPQERVLPASVIDTETAGRKEEKKQAKKQGRKKTMVTGPQGLLSPAQIKKKGLLSSE